MERKTGVTQDSDLSSGTLFSSGLIAGGSLAGILYAVLVGLEQQGYGILATLQSVGNALPFLHAEGAAGHLFGAGLFLALAVILARAGQRRLD